MKAKSRREREQKNWKGGEQGREGKGEPPPNLKTNRRLYDELHTYDDQCIQYVHVQLCSHWTGRNVTGQTQEQATQLQECIEWITTDYTQRFQLTAQLRKAGYW